MLDFSSSDARTWTKELIKENMLKVGRSVGWMHDFGEYTPMDVKFAGFQGYPQTYHNKYPYEWAKVCQEAIQEYGSSNETVYFMRAGSTMSPGATSLFWMGDQLTSLDKYDGLQSALIGLLNGGMSGFSLGHSDIGGYTSLNQSQFYISYRRDEETLMRWIEMNAFSDALYRTHPSNNPDFNA